VRAIRYLVEPEIFRKPFRNSRSIKRRTMARQGAASN